MRKKISFSLSCILALGSFLAACQVPVFRYALENWSCDQYGLLIFADGNLSDDDQALLTEQLKSISEIRQSPLGVLTLDVNNITNPEYKKIWEKLDSPPLPTCTLLQPEGYIDDPVVWKGLIGQVEQALLSPARRETAERLIAGETAVWLLITNDNEEQNQKTEAVINKMIEYMEADLKLPHELDASDTEYDTEMANDVPLKIDFSILKIDRNDPKEAMLMKTLRNTIGEEFDSGPLLVPVFGRGRALSYLNGNTLTEADIVEIGYFLVGPCSCQVKAMNPGYDLFLPVNWDGLVTGMIGASEALPPLSVPVINNPAAAKEAEENPTTETEGTSTDQTQPSTNPVVLHTIRLSAAVLLVIILATAVILNRNKKQQGS